MCVYAVRYIEQRVLLRQLKTLLQQLYLPQTMLLHGKSFPAKYKYQMKSEWTYLDDRLISRSLL